MVLKEHLKSRFEYLNRLTECNEKNGLSLIKRNVLISHIKGQYNIESESIDYEDAENCFLFFKLINMYEKLRVFLIKNCKKQQIFRFRNSYCQ